MGTGGCVLWFVSVHPKSAGGGAGLWCARALLSTLSAAEPAPACAEKLCILDLGICFLEGGVPVLPFPTVTSLLLCALNDECKS